MGIHAFVATPYFLSSFPSFLVFFRSVVRSFLRSSLCVRLFVCGAGALSSFAFLVCVFVCLFCVSGVCFCVALLYESPGGNQVDGSPLGLSTGAVVISSSLAPRRFITFATLNRLLETCVCSLLDLLMEPLIFHVEVCVILCYGSRRFSHAMVYVLGSPAGVEGERCG